MEPRQVSTIISRLPFLEVSDVQLLDRFVRDREESAFAELVHRHGATALGVCRRVLGFGPDAEDAFQATLMLLVLRGKAGRQIDSIAGWLHGTAWRVAMNSRKSLMRRRKRESTAVDPATLPAPHLATSDAELRAALDAEIASLPEWCRGAFVLCCLENRSRAETAAELGCSEGTISSRLDRAKKLLQARLTRRGFAPAAVVASITTAGNATATAIPEPLIALVTQHATLLATTGNPRCLPTPVATLVQGASTMNLLKTLGVVGLCLGTMAGLAWAVHSAMSPAETKPTADRVPQANAVPLNDNGPEKKKPVDLDVIAKELAKRGAMINHNKVVPPYVRLDMNTLFLGKVNEDTLDLIVQMHTLKDVQLGGSRLPNSAILKLLALKELEELNLGGSPLDDDTLKRFTEFPKLRHLWIAGTKVTDAGMEHVIKMKSLRFIGLFNMPISDQGIATLTKHQDLEELYLSKTQVSDVGLAAIAKLPRAHSLWVGDTRITDAGLSHLEKLPLKTLYLFQNPLTDRGAESLGKITTLEVLSLSGTKLTDVGIAKLKPLTKLTYLDLYGTKVTDAAVEALLKLSDLETLNLSQTQLTDEGLLKLAELKKLRIIEIAGSKVTAEGVKRFQERKPKCHIYLPQF